MGCGASSRTGGSAGTVAQRGPAAEESALRNGREVSPRDLVERILAARVHVAQELEGVGENLSVRNNLIFTNALATTFKLSDDDV